MKIDKKEELSHIAIGETLEKLFKIGRAHV